MVRQKEYTSIKNNCQERAPVTVSLASYVPLEIRKKEICVEFHNFFSL